MPKAGTPDLIVVCEGEAIDWAVTENKLMADESKDQTSRYADPETVAALSRHLRIDPSAGQPRFAFLILF